LQERSLCFCIIQEVQTTPSSQIGMATAYSPTYSILSHNSTTEVHLVSQTKIMRCYCISCNASKFSLHFSSSSWRSTSFIFMFSYQARMPHFTIMIVCRYLVKTCREAGITLNCAPNPNLGHLLAFLCQLLKPSSGKMLALQNHPSLSLYCEVAQNKKCSRLKDNQDVKH
jgi:hypothetical protein